MLIDSNKGLREREKENTKRKYVDRQNTSKS